MEPPAPITGNAYEQDLPQLATDWEAAIDLFEGDPLLRRILPAELIRNLVHDQAPGIAVMRDIARSRHWKTYLERCKRAGTIPRVNPACPRIAALP